MTMVAPSFNKDALATLTKNIESKLTNEDPKKPAKSKQSKEAAKTGVPKRTNVETEVDAEGPEITKRSEKPKKFKPDLPKSAKQPGPPRSDGRNSTSKSGNSRKSGGNDLKKSKENSKPLALRQAPETQARGKKRGRDGREKGAQAGDHAELAAEIRALGGDDADLALIEDASSNSELEGTGGPLRNDKLSRDLKSLVQQLGLKDNAPSDEESLEGDGPAQDAEESAPATNGATKQQDGKSKASKEKGQLLFKPLAEWHSVSLPALPGGSLADAVLSSQSIDRLFKYAKQLLEEENQLYASRNKSSSSNQFYSAIVTSGTLSDKISALTLSVQESPLHNMAALEQLVKLARKRSRSQAVDVLGALKDLFAAGSLLPSDRQLITFVAQPGLLGVNLKHWQSDQKLPGSLQKTHLVYWAFEDWLKSIYFEVIKIIEVWCNDQVVFARSKAVDYVFELLRDKPEQEVNLLRLLVNKLGDTERKIASKASYHLLQLQKPHPKMNGPIISNIESDILFRPNQSMHAKYYAVITLNQTALSLDEEDIVRKLLDIYFTLFVKLLSAPDPEPEDKPAYNKKGERQGGGGTPGRKAQKKKELADQRSTAADDQLKERMLSAILTGVNRAHPFASSKDDFFDKHMDTLFKVTHSSNFNTSVQALMLIQQLATLGSVDRFYRTLYESLLDPRLLTTSKHTLYLNLLFRAVKGDADLKRVKAFTKRMLQTASMHFPSVVCAILFMIRELEKTSPSIRGLLTQPEDIDGDDRSQAYDARKRDPHHSNAEASCLWEIAPFVDHFHPSASLFAVRLLENGEMPPKPDLTMHSTASFLDNFVKQNPKKSHAGARGSSLMQPLSTGDERTLFVPVGHRGDATSFSSENFWKKNAEKIDPSEAFFHKYYSMKGRGREAASKKRQKKSTVRDGSDEDSVAGEEEIWKALVDSRPELEEDDEDADMDDLESAMGSEDEEGPLDEDLGGDEELALDDVMSDVFDDDDELPQGDSQTMVPGADLVPVDSSGKRKKRKLKHLPTFASAEDYAHMLQGEEDE